MSRTLAPLLIGLVFLPWGLWIWHDRPRTMAEERKRLRDYDKGGLDRRFRVFERRWGSIWLGVAYIAVGLWSIGVGVASWLGLLR